MQNFADNIQGYKVQEKQRLTGEDTKKHVMNNLEWILRREQSCFKGERKNASELYKQIILPENQKVLVRGYRGLEVTPAEVEAFKDTREISHETFAIELVFAEIIMGFEYKDWEKYGIDKRAIRKYFGKFFQTNTLKKFIRDLKTLETHDTMFIAENHLS